MQLQIWTNRDMNSYKEHLTIEIPMIKSYITSKLNITYSISNLGQISHLTKL